MTLYRTPPRKIQKPKNSILRNGLSGGGHRTRIHSPPHSGGTPFFFFNFCPYFTYCKGETMLERPL